MRFYVAISDGDWFAHLSQGERPEEVNFWQPSGSTTFRALQPGEPFLFKLHSPDDFIVGGGFFSHFSILPVSLAWKAFGTDNGAETEAEVRARIEHYRRVKPNPTEDYAIGCILLQSPFFFDRKDWIPVPGWHKSIVRGRGYDTDTEPDRSLWSRVQALIGTWQAQGEPAVAVQEPAGGYGQPQVVLPRLGQGAFRVIASPMLTTGGVLSPVRLSCTYWRPPTSGPSRRAAPTRRRTASFCVKTSTPSLIGAISRSRRSTGWR